MKKKSIRQSKNLIISLFAAFLCLAAGTVRAQAGRVTIDMQQVKMTQIMDEIEKQTKFLFIYDKNISVDRTASVQVREQPVAEALAQMLAGTDLTYEINSSNIILSKRSAGKRNLKAFIRKPLHIRNNAAGGGCDVALADM